MIFSFPVPSSIVLIRKLYSVPLHPLPCVLSAVRARRLSSLGLEYNMGAYYDEVEIEDMAWDEEKRVYHYPCPCGDRFEISRKQLKNYEDIATCPSCSLIIRVVYDPVSVLLFCKYDLEEGV